MRAWLLAIAVCLPCWGQAGDVSGALAAVNQFRAASGVGPVRLSAALQAAAEAHARDMAAQGYFSHTGRKGGKAKQRARAQGYKACTIAENLAKGQPTLDQAMRDWIASASHRKVLQLQKVRDMGLAQAGGSDGKIWVLVLAADRC